MASIISSNVVQLTAFYTGGGANMNNVFHVHKPTAWSVSDMESLVSAFEDWETASGRDTRSDEVSLVRVRAVDLTGITGALVDDQLDTPIAGSLANGMMPANVTIAVKASIGERGRGRAGRVFWIGLSEASCLENSIVASFATDILASLDALQAALAAAAADTSMVVLHTVSGGLPLNPATFSLILGWVLTDLTLDSQKNRLPNHKRRSSPPTP